MASSSECAINIYTFGFYLQAFNNLLQHYRHMINAFLHNQDALFCSPVITSFAKLLNASGEKVSKNCWYLVLSQISILLTAETSTISFSSPAYSIRFLGSNRRLA